MDTVVTYTGPKIVLTRICVAVAGLVIHSIGHTWENPIKEQTSFISFLVAKLLYKR